MKFEIIINLCIPQCGMELGSGRTRRAGRGQQLGRVGRRGDDGARGEGERVRVAPGAVPRARARPARAPRHLRAQVLQHASAYGQ